VNISRRACPAQTPTPRLVQGAPHPTSDAPPRCPPQPERRPPARILAPAPSERATGMRRALRLPRVRRPSRHGDCGVTANASTDASARVRSGHEPGRCHSSPQPCPPPRTAGRTSWWDFMRGYFGCGMFFLVRDAQARVWRGFASASRRRHRDHRVSRLGCPRAFSSPTIVAPRSAARPRRGGQQAAAPESEVPACRNPPRSRLVPVQVKKPRPQPGLCPRGRTEVHSPMDR